MCYFEFHFPSFYSFFLHHTNSKTDEGEDVAYYESGDEVQKMGFQELDRLGLAGGIVLRHYPLHVESLSEGDAEEVMKLLADLPRPTYIMCRYLSRDKLKGRQLIVYFAS